MLVVVLSERDGYETMRVVVTHLNSLLGTVLTVRVAGPSSSGIVPMMARAPSSVHFQSAVVRESAGFYADNHAIGRTGIRCPIACQYRVGLRADPHRRRQAELLSG